MEKFKGLLQVCKTKAIKAFPEQQIYFRSNGNVRFVRLTPLTQMAGMAGFIVLFGGVTVAGVTAAVRHYELSQREERVEALEGDITALASRIESRQQLLLDLMNRHLGPEEPEDAAAAEEAPLLAAASVSPSGEPVLPGATDVSAELQRYRSFEQQQLALIRSASLAAETRIKETEAVLKRLGISTHKLVGQSPVNLPQTGLGRTGLGGPFVKVGLGKDGKPFSGAFQAPFRSLIASWNKLDSLERASLSIPSLIPVKSYHRSSSFGYRHDPFTGGGAFHTGVDLAGTYGEPVVAAAGGVVTRAEYWGAYGKMVEIDHGRGLVTRYGHMSAIKAKPGQRVAPGTVIGQMGSTGRSTGTHLHYEVRFDDRALNPLPFLKAAADLQEIQSRALGAQVPQRAAKAQG
ncbi:M23 family metallopeptidase [Pedomonas mirosovicensis]|uniref:M23 family metallopeptidase n=1 Tax=Pedomonas mirosovicensis TaxID=2908641 RepID=UPI00216A42F0|nr:M23 family metallopeptidase [Pedomonas mirosovicensis]MCH8685195.1 M23 family metallopeptidase [Pedomonas mirosovicensis]